MGYSDLYKTPSVQQAQNIVESGGKDTSVLPKEKPKSPVYQKVPVSGSGTVTKSIVDNSKNTLYKSPSVQQAEEIVAKATTPPSVVNITPISQQALSSYKQIQTSQQPSYVPKNVAQQQQNKISSDFGFNKPQPSTISGYTPYEKVVGFNRPIQPTRTEQLVMKSKDATSPMGKAGYYIAAVNRDVAEKNAESIMDIPKHPIKNTAYVVGGTAFTILAPSVATAVFYGLTTEEVVRQTGNTLEGWSQNSYENIGLISQPIATASQFYAQGKAFEFVGKVVSSAPEGVPKMLSSKKGSIGGQSARERSGKTSKAQLRERKSNLNTFSQGNFQGIKIRNQGLKEQFVKERTIARNIKGETIIGDKPLRTGNPNIKTVYTKTSSTEQSSFQVSSEPKGSSKQVYSTQPIEQYKARQRKFGKEGIVVKQDTSIKGFNSYGKDTLQPYSSQGDFITSSGVVKTKNVEGYNKNNQIQTRGSAFDNQNKLSNQQYSELDYKYNYYKQGNQAVKITQEPVYEGNINTGKVTGGFRKGMKEKLYGKLYEKKAQLDAQRQAQDVKVETVQDVRTETRKITSQESELKTAPFLITRQSQGTDTRLKQSNILGLKTAQKTEQGLATATEQETITLQDKTTKTKQDLLPATGRTVRTIIDTPKIKNPDTVIPTRDYGFNKPPPPPPPPPNPYTQKFTGWRQPTQPPQPPQKFKYGIQKPAKERKQGFDVLVRRGGKFSKVNTGALSQEQAIGLGSYRVGTTAAATFKIQPSSSEVTESNVKGSMGDFYRKGELFIEKNVRRIKSWGEKQEITFKGIQANRSGFNKIKNKLFGR